MLGDDLFRKCLHGFMDRWHGKHPIPWDMFNSFTNLAGKDLTWYWQNWFFTNYYPDLALQTVTPAKNGYTIAIQNIGGFAVPTNLMVEYTDGSKEKIHQTAGIWEKDQKQTTVTISTNKKIQYLKLDNGIFMDADVSNNSWGKSNDVVFNAAAVKAEDLDKFLGEYASAAIPVKITFTKEGNKLNAEVTGQGKISLTQTAANKFEFAQDAAVFVFDPTKNEMVLEQGGGKFTFTKK